MGPNTDPCGTPEVTWILSDVARCVSVECLALKPYCQRYSIECLSKCAMMLLTIMCSWIL